MRMIKGKLRFEIFKRDDFTCQYCGRKAPEVKLTIDHKKAQSAGGGDEKENLLTCCEDCNMGKGSTDLSVSDTSNFSVFSKDQLKNVHYPKISFRLSDETVARLKKAKGDKSWNLLFNDFLNLHNKSDRTNK